MAWANDDLVLYHGTDSAQVKSILGGLRLSCCRNDTDFGRGFYTTTSEHQAKQWANIKRDESLPYYNSSIKAVVFRFKVARNTLAALQSLVFIVGNDDYWDLVEYCRAGSQPHGRIPPPPEYEVVYGPVASWDHADRWVFKDSDQVSFHTDHALNKLSSPELYLEGNPRF